mmetsp:Transcript_41736/g.93791  ORF Transcript_41736/g.93791 Transcript_41736/m.93791 type:complete len:312 (+) Transcript_41736:59-994(+)
MDFSDLKEEDAEEGSRRAWAPPPLPAGDLINRILHSTNDEDLRRQVQSLPPEYRQLCERYRESGIEQNQREQPGRPRPPSYPPSAAKRADSRDSRDSEQEQGLPNGLEPLSRALAGVLRCKAGRGSGDNYQKVEDLLEVQAVAESGEWSKKDLIAVGHRSKDRSGRPRFQLAWRPNGTFIKASSCGSPGGHRRRSRSPRGSRRHSHRGGGRRGGKGGSRGPRTSSEEHLSKLLAKVLRHTRHPDLCKDGEGWVLMDNLLAVLADMNKREKFHQEDILDVVRNRRNAEGEQRFETQQRGHGVYVKARSKHTV